MASPLVTVGMPTRNRPRTLALALDAIQAQSYRNLEIIVSDNASDGGATGELVRARAAQDDRIAFVSHAPMLPMFTHFDTLLRRARGELFMWAADDDRYAPDFVATCLEALERNGPACVAATMNAQYETVDGPYPFFAEGSCFAGRPLADLDARLARVIDRNFGSVASPGSSSPRRERTNFASSRPASISTIDASRVSLASHAASRSPFPGASWKMVFRSDGGSEDDVSDAARARFSYVTRSGASISSMTPSVYRCRRTLRASRLSCGS